MRSSYGPVIKAITEALKDYQPAETAPSEEEIIETLGPLSNGPSPHSHGKSEDEATEKRRNRRRRRS